MSRFMMAENPTDAVRDTIDAGASREKSCGRILPSPVPLIFSAVSDTYSVRPSRICQTSASPNHGIVQSCQYSGCCRLGVCPERSLAANFVLLTCQCVEIYQPLDPSESFVGAFGSRPLVTARVISAVRCS